MHSNWKFSFRVRNLEQLKHCDKNITKHRLDKDEETSLKKQKRNTAITTPFVSEVFKEFVISECFSYSLKFR